jgi:hypothetical protein
VIAKGRELQSNLNDKIELVYLVWLDNAIKKLDGAFGKAA